MGACHACHSFLGLACENVIAALAAVLLFAYNFTAGGSLEIQWLEFVARTKHTQSVE